MYTGTLYEQNTTGGKSLPLLSPIQQCPPVNNIKEEAFTGLDDKKNLNFQQKNKALERLDEIHGDNMVQLC